MKVHKFSFKFMFMALLCLAFSVQSIAGSLEEDILFYTNRYRKSQGKPPLELNSFMSKQAAGHSKDMARGDAGFGHEGFEDRVTAVREKLGRVSAAAENVAYGELDAKTVVDGWIKSKPHRKNMLGNYSLMGIGVAKGRDGMLYFTQLFIQQ